MFLISSFLQLIGTTIEDNTLNVLVNTKTDKKPDAIDLNLSMVSDEEDEFGCYSKSDGKPERTFQEDGIQIHTSED